MTIIMVYPMPQTGPWWTENKARPQSQIERRATSIKMSMLPRMPWPSTPKQDKHGKFEPPRLQLKPHVAFEWLSLNDRGVGMIGFHLPSSKQSCQLFSSWLAKVKPSCGRSRISPRASVQVSDKTAHGPKSRSGSQQLELIETLSPDLSNLKA